VLLPRHLVAEHVREILRRIEEGTLSEARAAERAALERRREVVP